MFRYIVDLLISLQFHQRNYNVVVQNVLILEPRWNDVKENEEEPL